MVNQYLGGLPLAVRSSEGLATSSSIDADKVPHEARTDLKELDRRLDATRARLKTQQEDVARLERELQKNPPTLEQTQNSALTYRVTTHTRRATLNFSATLGNPRAARTLSRRRGR